MSSYKTAVLLLVAAVIFQFYPLAMPGALRRLSVALRLTEAYTPAYTSVIPTNAASLSLFLKNAKDGYLKDVKEDHAKAAAWTVVMGNEAGGECVLIACGLAMNNGESQTWTRLPAP